MDLAFDDHVIDTRATIVQGVESADLDLARLGIDIDHADISAKGEGKVRWVIVIDCLQSIFHALRYIAIGCHGDLFHGLDLVWHPFYPELIDVPFEVVFTHFEQVGGYLTRLVADFTCSFGDSSGAYRCRA